MSQVTPDEFEQLLNDIEREEREARRKARRDRCGTWMSYTDPHTGQQKSFQYHCRDVKHCTRCRKKVAGEERKRWMAAIIKGNDLYLVGPFPADQWERVSRNWRRHDIQYRRYAFTINSTDVIYAVTNTPVLGYHYEKFDFDEVGTDDFDLEDMLPDKTDGTYFSGPLGSDDAEEEAPDGKVEVEIIATNLPMDQEKSAWKTATERTNSLNPATIEELQEAIITRQDEYKIVLTTQYKAIISYTGHVNRNVRISDIDWKSITSNPDIGDNKNGGPEQVDT